MNIILNNKMAKIILPDRIFGRDVDGAMEKVLNGDKTPEPIPEQTVPQTNAPDLKGYILVPSLGLYVAKERTLLNANWSDAQEGLKKQHLMMPTPYQFREFLKYLRDSKNPEHKKIFNDVVEVRNPWRGEWINAKFENDDKGKAYLVSENILVNGKYQSQKQLLSNYLDSDKAPGISLDDWLNSSVAHGLPESKTPKGRLYYWAPVNGYVARFVAGSDWADLSCYGDAGDSDPSLGVRACTEGAVAKNGRK